MRLHRRPQAWLIALLALLGARHATAQAAHSPTAQAESSATAAARAAHERGLAAREKGDWQAARESFLEAWGHKRHWEIAVNLGEAEMKLGRWDDAVLHLSFVVADPGFLKRSPQLVEQERKQISAWLTEAESKIEARRRASEEERTDTAPPRRWVWIAGTFAGLAAVSLVSGGVVHAMAQGQVGEVAASLQTLPGQTGDPAAVRCAGDADATCRLNVERLRSADSMQSAATALFVTAGALAAATAALAVLWPSRRGDAPVVAPAVSAGGAGIAFSAAW